MSGDFSGTNSSFNQGLQSGMQNAQLRKDREQRQQLQDLQVEQFESDKAEKEAEKTALLLAQQKKNAPEGLLDALPQAPVDEPTQIALAKLEREDEDRALKRDQIGASIGLTKAQTGKVGAEEKKIESDIDLDTERLNIALNADERADAALSLQQSASRFDQDFRVKTLKQNMDIVKQQIKARNALQTNEFQFNASEAYLQRRATIERDTAAHLRGLAASSFGADLQARNAFESQTTQLIGSYLIDNERLRATIATNLMERDPNMTEVQAAEQAAVLAPFHANIGERLMTAVGNKNDAGIKTGIERVNELGGQVMDAVMAGDFERVKILEAEINKAISSGGRRSFGKKKTGGKTEGPDRLDEFKALRKDSTILAIESALNEAGISPDKKVQQLLLNEVGKFTNNEGGIEKAIRAYNKKTGLPGYIGRVGTDKGSKLLHVADPKINFKYRFNKNDGSLIEKSLRTQRSGNTTSMLQKVFGDGTANVEALFELARDRDLIPSHVSMKEMVDDPDLLIKALGQAALVENGAHNFELISTNKKKSLAKGAKK